MEEEKGLVKIGAKDGKKYVNATFWALDHHNQAILRGLGKRQGKVLEVKNEVLSIDSVSEEYTKKKRVDGMDALEVKLTKNGGGGLG